MSVAISNVYLRNVIGVKTDEIDESHPNCKKEKKNCYVPLYLDSSPKIFVEEKRGNRNFGKRGYNLDD